MKLTNEDLLHANLKQSFDVKKMPKSSVFKQKWQFLQLISKLTFGR